MDSGGGNSAEETIKDPLSLLDDQHVVDATLSKIRADFASRYDLICPTF